MPFGRWWHERCRGHYLKELGSALLGGRTRFGEGGGQLDHGRARRVLNPVRPPAVVVCPNMTGRTSERKPKASVHVMVRSP